MTEYYFIRDELTILVITIICEQIHLTLGGAALVRAGQAVAGQLVLVAPEQAGEGDVDEGGGQTLLEHIDADRLGEPAVVPDLPHAGEEGHVGDGDERCFGVSRTLGLVKEVEFPENFMSQRKLD